MHFRDGGDHQEEEEERGDAMNVCVFESRKSDIKGRYATRWLESSCRFPNKTRPQLSSSTSKVSSRHCCIGKGRDVERESTKTSTGRAGEGSVRRISGARRRDTVASTQAPFWLASGAAMGIRLCLCFRADLRGYTCFCVYSSLF
jgi:hypothetical protein